MNKKIEYKPDVLYKIHYHLMMERISQEKTFLWWKSLIRNIHLIMLAKNWTVHDIRKIINEKNNVSEMTYERFLDIYTGKIIHNITIMDLTYLSEYFEFNFQLKLESDDKDENGKPKWTREYIAKPSDETTPMCA